MPNGDDGVRNKYHRGYKWKGKKKRKRKKHSARDRARGIY